MIAVPGSGTELLIWLLGGVALLLWGMRMVRTGVQRAMGDRLRLVLARWLKNRFQAAAAGLGITLFLQSSMATCLLAGSFAGRGILPLAIALAVMLGADVGTSLVAQVFSFDLTFAIPILLFAGVATFMSSEQRKVRSIGRAILGLGLLLLALKLIVGASSVLREAPVALTVLGALSGEPLLAIVVAALIAWAMHSSLAAILTIAAITGGGDLSPLLLLSFVLGANLGGAIAPCLAVASEPPPARRVAAGNLAFKLIGVVVVASVAPFVIDEVVARFGDKERLVVNFHTAFNLGLGLVFLPMVSVAGKLLEKWFQQPTGQVPDDAAQFLDEDDLGAPKAALANASREVLDMATVLRRMVTLSREGLLGDANQALTEMSPLDDRLDATHENVKRYLTRLREVPLEEDESRRATEILSFMANLEHAGDIIDKTLTDMIRKKSKRRLSFSEDGKAEIEALCGRVLGNLELSMNVFMSQDIALARTLISEKEAFSALEREAAESHYERLRLGLVETIETSAYHLDALRDLKRVNSHLCSAAYPILDQAGALRRTRLKKQKNPRAIEKPEELTDTNEEPFPCVPKPV